MIQIQRGETVARTARGEFDRLVELVATAVETGWDNNNNININYNCNYNTARCVGGALTASE